MSLQEIVPNQIWCSVYPVKFGPITFYTRATYVKLADGTLWVHSPVPVDGDTVQQLAEIGPVAYVIAPNRFHHLFFQEFLEFFPNAQGMVAPGLPEKQKSLIKYAELNSNIEMPWSVDMDSVFIQGLPNLNETVWFHRKTGTLIITDLLFCFEKSDSLLNRIVASLLGVYKRLGMSRTMKFMIKDKEKFIESVSLITSWDVKRIVLAHDQIIEQEAKSNLIRAFKWLGLQI